MNRIVALALPALAIVLTLTACSDDDSASGANATAPAEATSTAMPTPEAASATPSPATTAAASPASNIQTITLNVSGGKVTGDTGRAQVKLGAAVDVAVTADVADEVHIHGYDLMVDTIPGKTVHKQFVARIPGVFEIELEQSKTQLTRLQVQ